MPLVACRLSDELFDKFSLKCLKLRKRKSEVLAQLIKEWVEK
jgi:hypothetical protein